MRAALTFSSHEFLKEIIKILWSFQHVCKLMEVEVGHEDIFGISRHIDHLKKVRSVYQQPTSSSYTLSSLYFDFIIALFYFKTTIAHHSTHSKFGIITL